MALKSRPSTFVTELLNDPEYGLVREGNDHPDHHTCGECGGALRAFRARDGQTRYRCEHTRLCGNTLPACSACGIGCPVNSNGSTVKTCPHCGARYPGCPVCTDGWWNARAALASFGAVCGFRTVREKENHHGIIRNSVPDRLHYLPLWDLHQYSRNVIKTTSHSEGFLPG